MQTTATRASARAAMASLPPASRALQLRRTTHTPTAAAGAPCSSSSRAHPSAGQQRAPLLRRQALATPRATVREFLRGGKDADAGMDVTDSRQQVDIERLINYVGALQEQGAALEAHLAQLEERVRDRAVALRAIIKDDKDVDTFLLQDDDQLPVGVCVWGGGARAHTNGVVLDPLGAHRCRCALPPPSGRWTSRPRSGTAIATRSRSSCRAAI